MQPGLLRYGKEREGILTAPLMPLKNSSFLLRLIVKRGTGIARLKSDRFGQSRWRSKSR